LAAAASALQRASGCSDTPFSLAFLTDRRRIAKPEPVMRALPPGAAVIYRDYDDPKRAAFARRYAALCRAHGVLFLIGGDIALARAVSADGVHFPSRMIAGIAPARDLIVTAACHGAADLALAHRQGANAAFLSPVFATQSHPGSPTLGAARFRMLAAAAAALPVLALGGVGCANSRALGGRNVAGIGAISAFAG
jgi:thiamine-phosphate pyrophosphorylase